MTAATSAPECTHCRLHDPCRDCGVRRDEHADQGQVSRFPALDIADHAFVEWREATPDHYVGADYITDCPAGVSGR